MLIRSKCIFLYFYNLIMVSNCTPAIFFGHGSPMNAIEDTEYSRAWISLMKPIRKPSAILAISAHWETSGTRITSNLKQKTIHDFGGFPRELFNVQYTPNGDANLVKRIQQLVPEAKADDDSYPWAHEFNDAIKQAISTKNYDQVINYQSLKGSRESVPTKEHYIPLIYIVGLQKDTENASFFADQLEMGSLSMTGVIIQ